MDELVQYKLAEISQGLVDKPVGVGARLTVVLPIHGKVLSVHLRLPASSSYDVAYSFASPSC